VVSGKPGSLNILVTGGAGYIGSVLVGELLKLGHKVTVLDNFMYGQSSLIGYCNNPNFELVKGDVRSNTGERGILHKLIERKFDFIFPLAAIVGMPACDKDRQTAQAVNFMAIWEMCNAITALKPETKVIFPNTNSGYGVGQKDIYCTEETPLKPISFYGRLKCEAEKEIIDRCDAVIFRLATVFGCSPRMRLDLLVNDMVYKAVKDGYVVLYEAHFKRNFIHILDVAGAFIHAMNHWEEMHGQIYNAGLSSANLSKMELCQEIKKQVPEFYIVEAGIGKDVDQRNYIVSNEKLEKTGWKPAKSLQDGISELVKAYQMPVSGGNV
jgi:nucleoside-diphosphate-sugar epimerase